MTQMFFVDLSRTPPEGPPKDLPFSSPNDIVW